MLSTASAAESFLFWALNSFSPPDYATKGRLLRKLFQGMARTERLDMTDRRLLRAVQELPEASVAELAEAAGLSPTPCWRRLKRLEQQGTIRRRAVLLDAAQLGFAVGVFANIKIKQHDELTLEAFEAAVNDHPEIVECFSMSGDSDYVMRVLAQSIEDYERFLKKTLLHLPGVGSINSSFALKTVKLTTDVPV